MGQRTKRKVKNRSKAHQKWVGAKRKSRVRARSKPGGGMKKRRKKKAAAKKTKKG